MGPLRFGFETVNCMHESVQIHQYEDSHSLGNKLVLIMPCLDSVN